MAVPPFVWLAGALAATWLGLRKLGRYLPTHGDRQAPAGTETVRCAHCGVFVPESLAVERQGRWYCGVEHAQRPPHS